LFDWTVFLASGCTCRTTGIRRLTEDETRTSDIVGDHVWRLAGDLNPQNLEDSAADPMVQYIPSQDEPFTWLKYRLPRYPVHSPCPSPRHPVRGREMARLTAQHSPIAKQHHPTHGAVDRVYVQVAQNWLYTVHGFPSAVHTFGYTRGASSSDMTKQLVGNVGRY
jgi:hypothetical protein